MTPCLTPCLSFRPGESLYLLPPFPGDHLKADLKILFDLQDVHQVAKAVLKEDSKDLAVAVQVTVGAANYANFSYAQH